jgi:hypothetical protein
MVGCAKLNNDAAVSKNARNGAVGVVCHSETGTFLGASTLVIQGIDDPSVLESLA